MTTQPELFEQPTTIPITRPATIQAAPERWLLDHLIRTGHLTETGLSRRARIRTCPCHQLVLAGLDEDICAFEVACDPNPLSPLGEALALVEGRRTLAVHRDRGRWVLDRRDHHDIAADPAGTKHREDVVREHRCTSPPPPHGMYTDSRFPETTPPLPADAQPTF